MNQQMKNILERLAQRKSLAAEIKAEIEDGFEGTITLNDSIVIAYNNCKTTSFTFEGTIFPIEQASLKPIFQNYNLETSMQLEEVLKICAIANK